MSESGESFQCETCGSTVPHGPHGPHENSLIQAEARTLDAERQNQELRNIIAALMVKYAAKGIDGATRRAVLNPDVLGAVEPSLLLIDTSVPGMVTIRYGGTRA